MTQPKIVASVRNSCVFGATHERCLLLGKWRLHDRRGGMPTVPMSARETSAEPSVGLVEPNGVSVDKNPQIERDRLRSLVVTSL